MSGVLTGRRAFITGSSSGIGAASARLLAAAGASIILHGRNAGKLAATEQEFRAAGFDVCLLYTSSLGPRRSPLAQLAWVTWRGQPPVSYTHLRRRLQWLRNYTLIKFPHQLLPFIRGVWRYVAQRML